MRNSYMTSASVPRGLAGVLLGLLVAPLLAGTVQVSVQEQTPGRIVLRYALDPPRIDTVSIAGRDYVRLSLGRATLRQEAGAPAVPHVCRSVIVPDRGRVTVNVIDTAYDEIANVDVIPSKGPLPRSVDPATVPYRFGAAYERDRFYPGAVALAGRPYIMRDWRGVMVELNPCQYNPVTHTLRVYRQVVVEVITRGSGGANELNRAPGIHETVACFGEIYGSHFLNYAQAGSRYDPLDEEGDLLIICHDEWLANIQPLADHKTAYGINTTVVGVGTIGNDPTAIKDYIQTVYDTSDLAFVLLVGDINQLATFTAVTNYNGAADPIYAKLAGDDDYPEIIVGRFSAEDSGDVDTQVERTIEYETLPATEQDWFWRGMGVASDLGIGDDDEYDNEHIDNIRDDLLAHGYTEVDQIYDPTGTDADVSAGLNAGRGIVNYCGHGGPQKWTSTGFDNYDVYALTNANMLPFIFSVACNNGRFDDYTCFAEAWLRSTHLGEPSGAVGAYMSSISQPWDPPMEAQDAFNLLYVTETYHSFGALCYAGACSMMDNYAGDGSMWGTGPATFNTWHIFGDPSLRVVGSLLPPTGLGVSPAAGLSASGPSGGPFVPNEIVYKLSNYDATPLEYALSKTVAWLDLSSSGGTIPAAGEVYVTVSLNGHAEPLDNGCYTDSVSFVNLTNHAGDTVRPVTLDVGVPVPVYVFNLDADPGWSTTGQWEFGPPTGRGGDSYGYPDPNSGATGANVCGVNLDGDYSTAVGGPYYLITTALDCTELTQLSLRFQRWLNSDYQPYVYATLEVSNNATDWQMLWQNDGGSAITEQTWTKQQYDISAVADDQATVYVRWGYRVTSGSWPHSGWNLDDVEMWGLPPGGYVTGDLNCDGTVNSFDIDPFVLALTDPAGYAAAFPECDRMLADCNGDGVVNTFDIDPFVELLTGE